VALAVELRLAELGRELQPGDLEPTTVDLLREAKSYTAEDLAKARTLMHASSRIMADFQREYDMILTPTLATPPIKHGII
jgi:Asp-tRNA(Asn)/Glu-tRNA(Gln) amidotransferase A subunit family amidase